MLENSGGGGGGSNGLIFSFKDISNFIIGFLKYLVVTGSSLFRPSLFVFSDHERTEHAGLAEQLYA